MPQKPLRVAVIGAGISGLAAARALQQAGHSVLVLEKSTAPGGRASSRFSSEQRKIVFDCGAQNIKSAGTALDDAARQVLAPDDFRFIEAPVCLHDAGQVLEGNAQANAERKWSCRGGLQTLGQALARDLDVRFETSVSRIAENADSFALHTNAGDVFDAMQHVIITAPAPQAATLLETGIWSEAEARQTVQKRINLLRSVRYTRCLSVLLSYAAPDNDLAWYALLAKDRTYPLLWLARENAKGFVPSDAGTVFIAQLGHAASVTLWDADTEEIARRTAEWIGETIGAAFVTPLWHDVKRWRYAQPRNTIDFEAINPPHARVLVCGDATARGRVPDAYESGIKAAARIIEDST